MLPAILAGPGGIMERYAWKTAGWDRTYARRAGMTGEGPSVMTQWSLWRSARRDREPAPKCGRLMCGWDEARQDQSSVRCADGMKPGRISCL